MTQSVAHPVAVVLGTRPEIIKLAEIVELLGERAVLVHTGQHYDRELSQLFLDGFGLPTPAIRLAIGGSSRAAQIGQATVELGEVFADAKPAAVIVQGDTNSSLAGALAANAVGVPLVHIEAGLRSYDRAMPEEHNRVLIDHLADLLAAPTPTAVDNLAREGLAGESVILCGNTVVEAVRRQLPSRTDRLALLARYGVDPSGYVLATIHRPENTDDADALRCILTELAGLPLPVLFPMHPRTLAAAERAGLQPVLDALTVLRPIDSSEFLGLAAEAAVLVSDSGGVQEEVTVIGRPLVVVRRSTERPESLVDFAVLVRPDGIGAAVSGLLSNLAAVHDKLAGLPSPYGDGTASRTIVRETVRRFCGVNH